jgi:hypothetical protein
MQGLFYGQQVNYVQEVNTLKEMFGSAIDEIGDDGLMPASQRTKQATTGD